MLANKDKKGISDEAIEHMEHFAHDCDERDFFAFSGCNQVQIELT